MKIPTYRQLVELERCLLLALIGHQSCAILSQGCCAKVPLPQRIGITDGTCNGSKVFLMRNLFEKNHNANRKRIWAVLSVTCMFEIVACNGCAQFAVNRALKQYKEQLDPSIGRTTKDDYVKAWGPPISTTPVSGGEVCVWRLSYGSRMISTGSQHLLYSSAYHFQQQSSHEMYDQLTLTFNSSGVLQTWRVLCQR